MKEVVFRDGDKLRIGCPLCNVYYPIGEKTNPPFRWTENDAINAVVAHIEKRHTILEIKTFFEDYIADKYVLFVEEGKKA